MPSRVSASLLEAVRLPELVCDSLNAYESLAVDLARNRRKLNQIRANLSRNRTSEPLFDSARTVQNLEMAYARMWEQLFLRPTSAMRVRLVIVRLICRKPPTDTKNWFGTEAISGIHNKEDDDE